MISEPGTADTSPIALMSAYGSHRLVRRIEVSITYPKRRIIVTHRVWTNDGAKTMDQITDEIVEFCDKHNAKVIQVVDRPLPMSEASTGKCPHCGGEMVRVPWTDK